MVKISIEDLKKRIHPDFKNLIICKKDIPELQNLECYGKDFALTKDEPSALPDQFEVEPIDDYDSVFPLSGYSFMFDELSPSQKFIYTQFLCEPYSGKFSSEYVYLFYCGLERLLITSKATDEVFDIVFKLREVYSERSTFRNYSARVLLYLSALMNNKKIYDRTIESIDLQEEFRYIYDYYIFATYNLNSHFSANDLMLMSNKFGFSNKLYINKYPEMFRECLANIIRDKYKNGYIPISKCVCQKNKGTNITHAFSPFANFSIASAEINTEVSENGKKIVPVLLQEAHNMVKTKLATLKKSGGIPEANAVHKRSAMPKPAISVSAFFSREQELIDKFENSLDADDKYSKCCDLCKYYYTYRKENDSYSTKCIKYSRLCITLISAVLQERSTKKEQEYLLLKGQENKYLKTNDYSMLNITRNSIDRLEEKYSYLSKIDAFNYLIAIFKEQDNSFEILSICDMALEYYAKVKTTNKISEMVISQQIEFFETEKAKAKECS